MEIWKNFHNRLAKSSKGIHLVKLFWNFDLIEMQI